MSHIQYCADFIWRLEDSSDLVISLYSVFKMGVRLICFQDLVDGFTLQFRYQLRVFLHFVAYICMIMCHSLRCACTIVSKTTRPDWGTDFFFTTNFHAWDKMGRRTANFDYKWAFLFWGKTETLVSVSWGKIIVKLILVSVPAYSSPKRIEFLDFDCIIP